MTPERWLQIEAILDRALDLPASERAAVVSEACGTDAALRAEVERLLAAMESPDLLPDTSAARYAAPLVARAVTEAASQARSQADGATRSDVGDGTVVAGSAAAARRATPAAPDRVGPYRILHEAGQGGMGTVYVAERDDGQFKKRVALKLVRRGLHLDDRFVRRFVEERRILARLEHPNVARLLDGGLTEDGLPYYVMEYVDGEPVDRFCDRRKLGVDERLALFCRVCGAVGYAHERGVVHRDLKPSNILVTADGEPKLLDFGIAKLLRDAVAFISDAPGGTLTRTGQRLLTPEYASPEQVRGDEVTAASDVYALGVLLYEILTGRRPYRRPGRNAHDVERAILEEEPTRPSTAITRAPTGPESFGAATPDDVSGARATTPDRLRQRLRGDLDAIVLTALRKEPARRYPTVEDFVADVRRHLDGRPVRARGDGTVYRLRKFARRNRVSVIAACAGMAAGVAAIVAMSSSGAVRLGSGGGPRLVPGVTRRVAFSTALELDAALSPDGRSVAYAADSGGAMRIYARPLAGGRVVALTASLGGYHRAPRWSPDGRTVAFQTDGRIYTVGGDGASAPRELVRPALGADWVADLAWSPDGSEIAYVQDNAIWVRPTHGRPARRLEISQPPREPHSLAWSPDGRWLAFVDGNREFTYGLRPGGSTLNLGNGAPSEIWLVPAAGGAAVRVTGKQSLNTSPTWLPDASGLLFVSNRDGDRDVYRVRIDASGHSVGGAPAERITAGLGAHTIALSLDGRQLAYAVFRSAANVWAIAVPPDGAPADTAAVPEPVTRGSQTIEGLAVSPDGRWLAFDTDRNGNQDIYIAPTRGSGEPAAITADPADEFMPHWAPDGRELAFYRFGPDGRRSMLTVPVGGGVSRPIIATPRNQRSPHWSPDGRSIVFSSDEETGRDELYVVTRGADGRWSAAHRLTTGGGYAGRWSPDGTQIVYARSDGAWVIPAAGGTPRAALRISPADEPLLGWVEWAPDGRTLIYKWVDNEGRASFWSLPATGGRARLLARLVDQRHISPRPEFATDGRRIYFTVAERESDVWTMALAAERP